jgi:hypothetical protein
MAADPQHLEVTRTIRQCAIDMGVKEPGGTGLFGGLTFSHDLIHAIGGEEDTNSNMTRRILLLLESRVLREAAPVRERLVRHLFNRYLREDRGYHVSRGWKVKVPRFLLNDVVRFWRTMAVDYAAKRRVRAGHGWAIRNFKLRLSRKLIFVSGLAMCLSCQLKPSADLRDGRFDSEAEFHRAVLELLVESSNLTPLERLADFALQFEAAEVVGQMVDCYEQFVSILDDEDKRTHLENMDVEQATSDPLFREAEDIGTAFQAALTKLFFHTADDLTEATQRYGVF